MLDIIASGSTPERRDLARRARALPADILQALAQDEDSDVRYWLAQRALKRQAIKSRRLAEIGLASNASLN
jgi:hypothetical protein